MPRKVKCVDTGEYSTSDIAYKAPNGKYYSSETVYKDITLQNKCFKDCVDCLVDLTGYGNLPFPTTLTKQLTELKPYGYDVVLETILQQRKSLQWAVANKKFKNEYQRFSYLFAIIKNNIKSVHDMKKRSGYEYFKSNDFELYPDEDIGTATKGKDLTKLAGAFAE